MFRYCKPVNSSAYVPANIILSALLALCLSACGDSGNSSASDDDDRAVELTNTGDSDTNSAERSTSRGVNGYLLTKDSFSYNNGLADRITTYELDSDARKISKFESQGSGDPSLTVIYYYDDNGFITKRENVSNDGVVSQTFNMVYDAEGRLVSGTSFNGNEAFLTTEFIFDEQGRRVGKEVTGTLDGSGFSSTTFLYTAGVLQSSELTSSLLSTPLINRYTMSSNGQRIERVQSIDPVTDLVEDTVGYEYDPQGNLKVSTFYGQDGAVVSTSTFEYSEVGGPVPNLTLHEHVFEFETL